MNRSAVIMMIALLLLFLGAGSASAQTIIYTNDFQTDALSGWSTTITDPLFEGRVRATVAPNGARFLGDFGNQSLRLDLTSLPAHDTIRMVFDLYVIRTWDGNLPGETGPDVWRVGLAGEPPIVQTSFNNTGFATQAYPDSFPGGVNRYRSGARANYVLGYADAGDAIYHFDLRVPHRGTTLAVDFAAALREDANTANLANESWGIDNITISTIVAPPVVSAATLEVGDLSGAPGEIVELPIRLRNARAIPQSEATGFTGTLRFDASLLLPIDGTPMGKVSAGRREIPLTLPAVTGTDSILATLRFRVALGSVGSTTLVLEDLKSIGGVVLLDSIAGRFTLTDLCVVGMTRLVANGAPAAIKTSPNPAGASVEVIYTLLEDAPASLELFDAAGTRIATLFEGESRQGEYRMIVDLSLYPPGACLLVLQTAGSNVSHRIIVAH